MNRVVFSLVLVLVAPVASGCSKKAAESTPVEAGVMATSAALDASSVTTTRIDAGDAVTALPGSGTGMGVKNRSDPRFASLPLSDRLAVEKMDRPKDALKAEAVFDALESKLKIPVIRRRQVLGLTVKAGYCELGDVEPGITLGVCEYDDEKSLAEGRAPARMLKIPNREIVEVKKLTTVAIQRSETTPEANAKAQQIADLVKKL